jgi:hypothetical protein|tara:strand:- start:250 stop:426 length:177 start_codon:yes stop_codon:yes gene_type:complete
MFSPEEWTVIRTGLDIVSIQGKDAASLASLQIKVNKEREKSMTKRIKIQNTKKQDIKE